LENLSEGIELFNNAEFFQSHDYFEDLWIDAESCNRLFFQGMVQISVGCYHLTHKNYKGALNQFIKGKTKLEKYPSEYSGVNIEKLLINVNPLIETLNQYFAGSPVNPSKAALPRLEYRVIT